MINFALIWKLFTRYSSMFLQGTLMTLMLSAITVVCGTILGTLLSLMKRSRIAPLRWLATAYIEIIRGTPLLLQLLLFVYVISKNSSNLVGVIVALVINSSAYVAEIIRAGIQAVDTGQMEAARSLGMTQRQAMQRVILPQAVKNILPTLGNEFIMVIKESSLGSTFFIGELMSVRAIITGATFVTIEVLIIVGLIYFVLTFTLSKLVGLFERRMALSD